MAIEDAGSDGTKPQPLKELEVVKLDESNEEKLVFVGS